MTRRCSHCGQNGHNSRTCPNRGVKLFGVTLTDGSMRKSASMGNLSGYSAHHIPSSPPELSAAAEDGYASDGMVQATGNSFERKKGIPWTEEEHKMFLVGLQQLGKGDWRGISRNYVTTRTPAQVASHAQKYFIRQSNFNRKKRRSSLFDMTTEAVASLSTVDELSETTGEASASSTQLSLGKKPAFGEGNSFDPNNNFPIMSIPAFPCAGACLEGTEMGRAHYDESEEMTLEEWSPAVSQGTPSISDGFIGLGGTSSIITGFLSFGIPLPVPFRPGFFPPPNPPCANSNIVKPTASLPTAPMKIDISNGISQLNLSTSPPNTGPTPISLRLSEHHSRHSAFHANPSINNTDLNENRSLGSAIRVV